MKAPTQIGHGLLPWAKGAKVRFEPLCAGSGPDSLMVRSNRTIEATQKEVSANIETIVMAFQN